MYVAEFLHFAEVLTQILLHDNIVTLALPAVPAS